MKFRKLLALLLSTLIAANSSPFIAAEIASFHGDHQVYAELNAGTISLTFHHEHGDGDHDHHSPGVEGDHTSTHCAGDFDHVVYLSDSTSAARYTMFSAVVPAVIWPVFAFTKFFAFLEEVSFSSRVTECIYTVVGKPLSILNLGTIVLLI